MESSAHFFIITGLAGVGKSTLVSMLLNDLSIKEQLQQVVTYTTRKPRVYEKNGIDYHFITEQDFIQKIESNFFIEYNHSHHYYGTSAQVIDSHKKGIHQIIILDPIGAQSFKKLFTKAHIITICVANTIHQTLQVTQQRMIKRGTEDQESLKNRLEHSYKHLLTPLILEGYQIVNDDLELSFNALRKLIVDTMNQKAPKYAFYENKKNI